MAASPLEWETITFDYVFGPYFTSLEKRRARDTSVHRDRGMGIDETGPLSS